MATTLKNLFKPRKDVVVLDVEKYNELMKRLEFVKNLKKSKTK